MKKYIVREGDTLESISHETGVEWKLLVAANPGVDGRRVLPPGQVIAVPDIGNGAIRHQPAGVQGSEYAPNPALEKAKRPDKQQPEEKMPGYFGLVWPHVVSSGEDWSTVSQEYQVPLGELLRMNATFANRELAAGDILYIPNVVMESRVSDNGEKAWRFSRICRTSNLGGRPPWRPRARAASRPARVLSRIRLRSNSARAAKT